MNEWVWSVGGMILTGENRSAGRKPCSNASLSTTNPTWTVLGSSPGLSFSVTKTKLLVLFRWCESRSKHVLCTHLALQKVTRQCTMNGTAESKTDLLTWRLCSVLRPQNGPLCVHSVALAVSRARTFVVQTLSPIRALDLYLSFTLGRKVGWTTSCHHREPTQLSVLSDKQNAYWEKRRRSVRLWQRRRLKTVCRIFVVSFVGNGRDRFWLPDSCPSFRGVNAI